MGFFDEEYTPQQLDDHDLMFRMRKKLGRSVDVIGLDLSLTHHGKLVVRRPLGSVKRNPVNARSHHKNSKLFHKRYKKYYDEYRIIEDRELPE